MHGRRRDKPTIHRRAVLRLGAAAAVPAVVPAAALGRNGAAAPSDQILLAAIGTGSRGRHDLSHFLREKDDHISFHPRARIIGGTPDSSPAPPREIDEAMGYVIAILKHTPEP